MRDDILNIFKSELNKRLKGQVKKIILFGSRARGDNAPDSDYDLLLLLDNVSPETKKTVTRLEGDLLYNYNVVFSAFPFLSRELEQRKFDPFIMNVQREGREI